MMDGFGTNYCDVTCKAVIRGRSCILCNCEIQHFTGRDQKVKNSTLFLTFLFVRIHSFIICLIVAHSLGASCLTVCRDYPDCCNPNPRSLNGTFN